MNIIRNKMFFIYSRYRGNKTEEERFFLLSSLFGSPRLSRHLGKTSFTCHTERIKTKRGVGGGLTDGGQGVRTQKGDSIKSAGLF